jgi:uncharacterized protein YecE (DUF72 family)
VSHARESSTATGLGIPSYAEVMPGARIRIGCSGWEYRHWRGDFYPRDVPKSHWLEYYAQHFDTVELNGTFYRLPDLATFEAWRGRVPPGFRFAVKASRYLTHNRRLQEPSEPLNRLWTRALHLRGRLGPMLYQLPPRWRLDIDRLNTFLEALPPRRRQAIEFRDPSWHDSSVYALLHRHRIALCLHDMPQAKSPAEPIGPFVYVRFHGRAGTYGGRYPDGVLDRWADRLAEWKADGLSAWVYFNNDVGGNAPRDAVRLQERLERAL